MSNLAVIKGEALSFLLNRYAKIKNGSLQKATYELARSGLPKEFVFHLLQSVMTDKITLSESNLFHAAWGVGSRKGLYKDTKHSGKASDEDIYEKLAEEFTPLFTIFADHMGNRNLLLEKMDNNTCRAVVKDRILAVAAEIVSKNFSQFLSMPALIKHVDNWSIRVDPVKEEPKSIALLDDPTIAYNRVDFTPKEGSCPTFDEFMGRCTNRDAFQAFIWSLFEPKADRQQYLWITGEGGDGKSSCIRFLEEVMCGAFVPISATDAYQNRYFTANFIGKRLAVFPDANSRNFVGSERFKQLTGGDAIPIENKFEKPYAAKLDTKFILLSNTEPALSGKSSDMRRLILIHIEKFTGQRLNQDLYLESWMSEREAILYKCRESYNKLTKKHSGIDCDYYGAEALNEEGEYQYESLFNTHFYLDPKQSLTGLEVYNIIRNAGSSLKVDLANFRDFMKRKYNIEYKRDNSRFYYIGVGKK